MNDLNTRARAILGVDGGDIRWPYGMGPERRRYTPEETEEQFAQRDQEMRAKQEAMLSWAEQHGLKYGPHGCCPAWLRLNVNGRCRAYREGTKCTRYANGCPDRDWLDHAVGWLKDGKPAVLTSAPYSLRYISSAPTRLAFWTGTDERMRVTAGDGWYSPATTQIIMWRSDRIEDVQPATIG
ncbi:hypothetical protein [Streptomyces osmaniensis]|uniref:Uncharacterized protein n=1 Tax=Streptomyces osmaniensis TaxID=593134 RepID=A0ABP6YZT4_9ACTN|nr:hypothetical protein KJK32_45410 [Streptomyces sp. JCM17656]